MMYMDSGGGGMNIGVGAEQSHQVLLSSVPMGIDHRFVSALLSYMDPSFLIIIDIFLLMSFGWSVWKCIVYRFCDILSL